MSEIVWGIVIVISISIASLFIYVFIIKDTIEYNSAKREIFTFVKSYKRRCTGANRFEVTVISLQDSFREYDTEIIEKVWLDLVKERVIEMDSVDSAWCVKKG